MDWNEVMTMAKNAIKAQYPTVDTDKLEQVYSSRMMELQRVLLHDLTADVLYSVTVDILSSTTVVKKYAAVVG